MEALCPSENFLSTYKATRCQNAEDHILNNDLRDNLRIYIFVLTHNPISGTAEALACKYLSGDCSSISKYYYLKLKSTRQRTYKGNIKARSRNHSCREKTSITYSGCLFVALVIQHTKRMRRIILSSISCHAVQYFPIVISHTARSSGRGGSHQIKRVFIFSTIFFLLKHLLL